MQAQTAEDEERIHRRLIVKIGRCKHGRVKRTFTYDGTIESLLASAVRAGVKPGELFYPDISGKFGCAYHLVERDGRLAAEKMIDRRQITGQLYSMFTTVRKTGGSLDAAIASVMTDRAYDGLWQGQNDDEKRELLHKLAQPRIPKKAA